MNTYTLTSDAYALGEDPKYGFTYQGYADEVGYPLRWSSKGKNFFEGVKITADRAETKTFKSGKHEGEQYAWLTGVKVAGEEGPQQLSTLLPEKASNDRYLKDLSDAPFRVFTGSLNYASQAGLNLIGDSNDFEAYMEFVRNATDELLKYSDNIRNLGSQEDSHGSSQPIKAEDSPAEVTPNEPEAVGIREEGELDEG